MKSILVLFISTMAFQYTYACLGASQNRLFPLGISSKGFLVVETHLQRSEYTKGERMEPAWAGKSYFKIYDEDYQEIYSELIETLKQFEQRKYEAIISGTFARGLKLARKYPGFVPLKPVSITFCDYQENCSSAGLVFDTIANKISIQLANKQKYEVKPLMDTSSIASNFLHHFQGDDEIDLPAVLFQCNLYINSIREFRVGDKKLTVVHIGTGQIFDLEEGGTDPPGKEYKPGFEFRELKKSTFEEPVLHHGIGFDFYIWN